MDFSVWFFCVGSPPRVSYVGSFQKGRRGLEGKEIAWGGNVSGGRKREGRERKENDEGG